MNSPLSRRLSLFTTLVSICVASPALAVTACFELDGAVQAVVQAPRQVRLRPAVVIVAPVSSGRHARKYFRDNRIEVITVDPGDLPANQQAPLAMSDQPHLWHLKAQPGKVHDLATRLHELAQANGLEVRAVVPGAEWGTQLAMELAQAFGHTQVNAGPYHPAYRMKSDYVRRLGQDVFSFEVQSVDAVERLMREIDFFRNPRFETLVVKPLDSAGGEGVAFVQSREELLREVDALLKSGKASKGVLLQEYLGFEEGAIDAWIARDPKTGAQVPIVTEGLRYEKWKAQPGAKGLKVGEPNQYRTIWIEPPTTQQYQVMLAKTTEILKKFRDYEGWIHWEYIMKRDRDGNFTLGLTKSTDGGFRPAGADMPEIVALANGGPNQFTVAADLIKDPTSLERLPRVYVPKRPTAEVFLNNFKKGAIVSQKLPEILNKLRALADKEGVELFINVSAKPGQEIGTTDDLFSKLGLIAVAGKTPEQVKRWIALIEMLPWYEGDTGSILPIPWDWTKQPDIYQRYKDQLKNSPELAEFYK